ATSGDLSSVGGVKAWSSLGIQLDLNPHRDVTAMPVESSAGESWRKSSPLVLTDLEGDGYLDLVAVSIQDASYAPLGERRLRKNRSSIYAWTTRVPYDG